jgi:hypothetical protein
MSQEMEYDSPASEMPAADSMSPHSEPRELRLVAYELIKEHGFELVPASPNRDWMNSTTARYANRCLPLLMANQAGWLLLNNATVHARWAGADNPSSIEFHYECPEAAERPKSLFGYGIITWNVPFLFRTPPGFDLLVRGPANRAKDGIASLEGLVETDWTSSTFTINWKFTRPHVWVTFEEGEPLCMLVPQRRGNLDEFDPSIVPIDTAADVQASFTAWCESRNKFRQEALKPDSPAAQVQWQKHYFQGKIVDGSRVPQHQTRMHLRAFTRVEGA